MSCSLLIHREGEIARLELTAPDGLPRLGASLLDELESRITPLFADATCRALVIHGTEKCFAAGADIGELAARAGLEALATARRGQRLFDLIAGATKPVVAAISGYCLGGGLDLALACSARLATPDALFGHPGPTLGIITGWGGTQRLPRLIGRARAFELLLTGGTVTGAQALALGLVDELVAPAELMPRALACARQLAGSGTTEGRGDPSGLPISTLPSRGFSP